jgi:hypothetical protein
VRALLRASLCLAVAPLAVVFAPRNALAQSFSVSTPTSARPVVNWTDGLPAPNLVSVVFDPYSELSSGSPNASGLRLDESWTTVGGGAVDRVRIASGVSLPGSPGSPVWLPAGLETYDVSYTRGWPSALSLRHGPYAMDFTPHAGFGMTSLGGSAEAGATVRVGPFDALQRFGVEPGGIFGQKARWYLYAEASGQAVGYNFLHTDEGWRRSGMSLDEGAYIGDAQAGVAWRRGDLQASFGYVERTIKLNGLNWLSNSRHESMIAFTLSFKPH